MPRRNEFRPKQYYHLYNRGFKKMEIFPERINCERFDRKLNKYAVENKVFVKDLSLMGNHFHMLAKCYKDGSMEKFMQSLQQSHAIYFNLKYRRRGQVFEGRFGAKAVTEMEYFLEIQRYIAMNPIKVWIRAGKNISRIGYPSG